MTTSSICTRSIATAFAFSIASAFAPIVSAATEATTVPVGFITKTIPQATDASTPSNTVLSIPLYQTADFQSSVASTPTAGAHTITLNSAAFTTNQFTTTPHLLRVKSGALTGKFLTILSHDATTLTLKEPNGGTAGVPDANLTGLLANDTCEILPANTFGSTFGANALIGSGTNAGDAGVDNVLIWNGNGYFTYYYNSNNNRWQKATVNATNTIIFPDDAVFFTRKVTSPLSLTFMGTVPSTSERTELLGSANNFMANRFPTDATLATSGIENTPGWVKGGTAGASDNVLIWNGSGFFTYYFNDTNNRWQKATVNAAGTSLPAASGFFVVRSAGTADTVLTQSLPYTP